MEGIGAAGADQRRRAVATATAALTDLADLLPVVAGADLGDWMAEVDRLAVLAAAARVAVATEAHTRGVVADSQCGSLTAWVAEHAPSTSAGGAGAVARAVEAFAKPANAPVRAAVLDGRVAVPAALTVVTELDRLRPLLVDGAEEAVAEGLLVAAGGGGSARVRALRGHLLAHYGLGDRLQQEEDVAKRHVELSAPISLAGGLWHYDLTCDVEAKAVIEAAIGPLSRPVPGPDGERDPRGAGQRRGQAVVEALRRAMATGGIGPAVKAAVYVTVSFDDLRTRLGAGRVVGTTATGDLLGAETVRRLACDAGIIPVVLGGAGDILDVGRVERLVTPGLLRRLWLRDGCCTFPGCSTPAQWADAHHLHHWADGGSTAMDNLALLCGRHHTVVHRDRLHGVVDGTGGVVWDRRPDSYDRWLAMVRTERDAS